MGEAGKIRRKSLNSIDAQRKRIEDSFRDAYYRAERIDSNAERRAELDRLNRRLNRVNAISDRYITNIMSTKAHRNDMSEWGQSLRGGAGREERKAIVDRAKNRTYSRSVYAKNNRRK